MPNDSIEGSAATGSTGLPEAIESIRFWLDQWADSQSEVEELSDCDRAEREIIRAGNLLLKLFPDPEDYVAYLRWNGHTFVTCDSDEDGAFKVCRHPHP